MDLKALIAKMDQIESKRFLTEDEDRIPAKKKETSWTDKSGKKHPATQVQGHQSRKADKEAEKESKKDEGIVFRSAIGQELLKEFGLNENPFQRLQAWHQKNTDALAAKEKEEAAMSDPANIEAFRKTLTPSQLKWVGGANLGDPIIRSRIPPPQPGEKPGGAPATPAAQPAASGGVTSSDGKPVVSSDGKPVQSGTTAPAGGQAAQPAKPAAAPGVQAQGDDEGNTMVTTPDGKMKVVGPDGNVIPPGGGKQQPAQAAKPPTGTQAQVDDEGNTTITKPDGTMQVTGPDGKVIPPGGGKQPTATAAAPTGGQAAQPAKPAGGTQVQTDDEGNHMITTPDGKTQVVGPDGKPLPNGGRVTPAPTAGQQSVNAQGQNVTMPDGTNPETGQKTQAATAAAPAPAAGGGGQAAQPARARATPDPKVKELQDKLIAAGAKIKADGIMGPQTQAAMKQFPQAAAGGITPGQNARDDLLARQGRSSTGVNSQGQNVSITNPDGSTTNPETGQRTGGSQAASPAAPQKGPNGEPAVKDPRTGKMGYMKRTGRSQTFVPFPEGGQAASPAPANPGRAVPGGGNLSDIPMPESSELARIRSLVNYRW